MDACAKEGEFTIPFPTRSRIIKNLMDAVLHADITIKRKKTQGAKQDHATVIVEGAIHPFHYATSSPEQNCTHSFPWQCITKRTFLKG